MRPTLIILLISLVIAGCSTEKPKNEKSPAKLRNYVISAAAGDTSANIILSGLIDAELPAGTQFTTLAIDSIKLNRSKKLYSVLLQFENPLYNRLAVYDSDLNLLLIDQSLNGNISVEFSNDNRPHLKVVEGFISKDMINLKRLSLYHLDTSAVRLSFRSFLSMSKPDLYISQDIEQFTDSVIITNITFPAGLITAARKDTFIFNSFEHIYKSEGRIFDSLVIKQVNNYKQPTFLPEIVDKKTIRNNY